MAEVREEAGGAGAVTIERLRWWHIEQAVEIEADLFGAQRWTAASFWNELANGTHYAGALSDGALIGYVGVALAPPTEAWINNIAVRRDRQHGGVGTALLEYAVSYAQRSGVTSMLLEVAADNAPAQRLYDRHGFEVVGVRRGYYQPGGTDALVMRKDLGRPLEPTGD